MIYEITGAQCPMTILAKSKEAAICAVLLLGQSDLGLQDFQTTILPRIFLLENPPGWLADNGIDVDKILIEKTEEVIEALESILYGDTAERVTFSKIVELMAPAAHAAFRQQWNFRRRDGGENVAAKAAMVASQLREIDPANIISANQLITL